MHGCIATASHYTEHCSVWSYQFYRDYYYYYYHQDEDFYG